MRRSIRSFNIPPEKPLSIRTFEDWILQILPPTPRWAKVVPDLMVTLFFVKQVYSTRKTWQFGFKFPTPPHPHPKFPNPLKCPCVARRGEGWNFELIVVLALPVGFFYQGFLSYQLSFDRAQSTTNYFASIWLRRIIQDNSGQLSMVFKGSLHILWSQLDNYLIYLLLVLAA